MSEPTSSPQNTATVPAGRERRVWVRLPAAPETPLFAVSEPDDIISWKARVRDISQGGASLILHGTFPDGTTVDIVFPPASSDPGRTLTARVVRSQEQDDLTWLVGCAFLQALPPDEVQALLDASV